MLKRLFLIGLVGLTSPVMADVEYLNLELKRMPFQRDYLFPGQTEWGHEVTLNFKAREGIMWFESDLTGQTYGSRFRNVWWDYTLGFDIVPQLSVIWDHRSQHAMDLYVDKFPVRDSAGIRWNMIR